MTDRAVGNKHQFGGYTNVEHVPLHELDRLREYDRWNESPHTGYHAREHIRQLADSMKEHGTKEPLLIIYGKQDRLAYLGEGNHRLAAAHLAGIPALPTRVIRQSRIWGDQGRPVPGHDPAMERHGYIPADLRPSDIGLETHEPERTES